MVSSRSITELMLKERYNVQLRIMRALVEVIQYFGGIRKILILLNTNIGTFWIVQKSNLMSRNLYRVFHIIRQRELN